MWRRYWFAPGGKLAAAIVRIALGISALLLLNRLRGLPPVHTPELMSASVYHPVGAMLAFPSPPPAIVIELAGIVACTAALAMIVGLASRTATALCAIATLVVASQAMSYQPTWSHDLNVVLLALIAFLGARGGDALSLDAWLRGKYGPPLPELANYQWSLRLVQFAVGLMFLSACVLKLRSGGIDWALSDNLRHQLLARYDLVGSLDRPAIVDWLLEDAWHWKLAASLNLIAQAAPLLAILFINRPWVRAFAGVMFVVEVAALYVVMELGNPSWFPLAVVFFDWDRIVSRLRPRPLERTLPPPRMLGASLFIAAFVLYDLAISFTPKLDQQLRTFPFSRFPMFAIVRAKQPYDTHQTYELIGGRIEPLTSATIPAWVQNEIARDYVYRTIHRETDPRALEARTRALLVELRRRYPDLAIRGVRVWITTYQAPAHPAPAHLVPLDLGIFAELDGETYRSRYVGPAQTTAPIPADGGELRIFADGLPSPLRPTIEGLTITLPAGKQMIHVVASDNFVITRRAGGYW